MGTTIQICFQLLELQFGHVVSRHIIKSSINTVSVATEHIQTIDKTDLALFFKGN